MSSTKDPMEFFRYNRNNVDSTDSLNMEQLSLNTDSSHSTSSSNVSIDNLDFARLSPGHSRYTRFKRYFQQFVDLARGVLARDRTFDPPGRHFFYFDQYLALRDRIHRWMAQPSNSGLFTDNYSYFYLAHLYVIMRNIEKALALPLLPGFWPGAVPALGTPMIPCWPGVQMRDVFRHFDELIIHGRDLDLEAMPWNCSDGNEMSG